MVNYIKADNYKTLVNFKIEFSNLNIIYGKNGVGKTTVFQLLRAIKTFISGERRVDVLFPPKYLTRWQNVDIQTFEMGILAYDHSYVYNLEIEHVHDKKLCRVKSEKVICDGNVIFEAANGKARLYNDYFSSGPEILVDWSLSGISLIYERDDNKLLTQFKKSIKNIIICKLSPFNMESQTDGEDVLPNEDFSNFVEVFRYVLQARPDELSEWRYYIKNEINDDFIRAYLYGDGHYKELKFDFGKNNKITYSFEELSDGEKIIFALYFLIFCYGSGEYSIFVDEPDNYVSPQEIQPWLQLIEDKCCNNFQCVIISHHPETINFLAQSSGIWMKRMVYGTTYIDEPPVSIETLAFCEYLIRQYGNEQN